MAVIVTGRIGLDSTGSAQVYTPPNVTVVTPGSTVSYGQWLTLQENDVLPNAPLIFEVDAGAAPMQAVNQVIIRNVTID